MSEINEKFAQAEKLYAEKEYSDALEICNSMLDTGDVRVLFLSTKCMFFHLFSYAFNEDDEEIEEGEEAVIIALTAIVEKINIDNLKEIYDFVYELKEEMCCLRDEVLFVFSCEIKESNEKLNYNWIKALKINTEYLRLCLMIDLVVSESDDIKKLLESEGLSYDEAKQKYTPDYDEDELKFKECLYLSVAGMLEDTGAYYNANTNVASEYAQSTIRRLHSDYITYCLMMENVIGDYVKLDGDEEDDDEDSAVSVELDNDKLYQYLNLYARCLHDLLSTVVYVDGSPISILRNDRIEYYKKLEIVYERMNELKPEFIAPPMPDLASVGPVTTASSPSSSSRSGGCYVATCVYGSYDCPEVWTLRRFRDFTLAKSFFGRCFIKLYYAISPSLVRFFGKTSWFKSMWKPLLDKMVEGLREKGVEDTEYNDPQY